MKKWSRIFYQPNLPLNGKERVTGSPAHIALSREAAAEGMVLLKNEAHTLPLSPHAKLAIFGKGSVDYVKGGGGSGDVYCEYVHNIPDGLRAGGYAFYQPLEDFYEAAIKAQYANGAIPGMTEEPELPDDLLQGAAAYTDTAVFVISRFSGEGWDRSDVEYHEEFNPWESEVSMPQTSGKIYPDGDFYLTKNENALLETVCCRFSTVIVLLNIGGVIDTSRIKNDGRIKAAVNIWQAGMEGGDAVAELLYGKINPSGKLTDTFAASLSDYPSTAGFHTSPYYVDYEEDIYVGYRYFETIQGMEDRVCYPFGFGLSYTEFSIEETGYRKEGDTFLFDLKITNTGTRPGKEVVQLYAEAPQGKLGKAKRSLADFEKTGQLHPGESQLITLQTDEYRIASYDDLGKVEKSAYVLEKGEYRFHIGNSVRDTTPSGLIFTLKEDKVLSRLSETLSPAELKKRLLADGTYETLPPKKPHDPDECLFEKMRPGTGDGLTPETRFRARHLITKPYKEGAKTLSDVAAGTLSLDEFMSQLSDDDLISLLGGQPNTSVANTFGIGNLPEYGVPNAMTADGPAGVRIAPECGVATTAWPCATLLACTWNTELLERVGKAGGKEVKENNLALWLTPAVNIHRNPMCGRNFEYYSEDPYLTGKLAASFVRGVQSNGVGACVKHFACNNKEVNRLNSDSRVSERALREIYLKAFEMIVKTAEPWCIMSSYNIINGYRTSECKELLTDILRGEWGYRGLVTTDWWCRGEHYKEILSGNDVKMGTGYPERVQKAMELHALTRDDLNQRAKNVLEFLLKLD